MHIYGHVDIRAAPHYEKARSDYVPPHTIPFMKRARTRYVATDLVTSQSFQPIRCAFMLCEFGRIRAVYVATRIQAATCRLRGHQNTSGYVPSTWPPEYKRLRAVYVATRIQVATCRLRGHQNTSGYVPSTWPPEVA